MKSNVSTFIVLALLSVALSGCHNYKKSITEEAKFDIVKPIDCNTAVQDIGALESEKATLQDQLKAGVKMATPVGAVRSILHGDYLNKGEVLIGEYNYDIEQKIKEIKNKCGLAK